MTALAWTHGVLVSWCTGLALVVIALGRGALSRTDLVPTFLAFWIGLVASSLVRWALQVADATAPSAILWADHLVLVALLAGAMVRWRRSAAHGLVEAPPGWLGSRDDVVAAVFAVALLALGLRAAVAFGSAHPFGLWDAVAIWNLKARALAEGGARWAALNDLTGWPDYPLLVPLSVARLWAYTGQVGPEAPRWTGELALAALAGLLFCALRRERGPWIALTGLAVLLAARPVVFLAASQYADLPLGGLELAALVCLWRCWQGREAIAWGALCGACTAATLWTKNDGAPFFLAVAAVVGLGALVPRLGLGARGTKTASNASNAGRASHADDASNAGSASHADDASNTGRASIAQRARAPIAWIAGALPVLSALVLFKLEVPSDPGGLIAGRSPTEVIANAARSEHWEVIVFAYGFYGREYLGAAALALLVLTALVIPARAGEGFWPRWGALVGVVLLQMIAYTLVFVMTPWDIAWHTTAAMTRLILHVWPCAVWLAFLVIDGASLRPRSDAQRA